MKRILQRIKFAYQRVTRYYDDSAIWNLDIYITSIAIPVLRHYRENGHGFPTGMKENEWNKILDKMITAFEIYLSDDYRIKEKKFKQMEEGLALFAKHFHQLWD